MDSAPAFNFVAGTFSISYVWNGNLAINPSKVFVLDAIIGGSTKTPVDKNSKIAIPATGRSTILSKGSLISTIHP